VARFVERAQLVLAQQAGMTAKAQLLLEDEATRLGLTSEQAEAAIRQLRDGPPAPPQAAPGAIPQPPVQAPPANSPQTVFLAYVREVLTRSSKTSVSARKEKRLIQEGARKLGLSDVLARQIVHRTAADLGRRLASHDATANQAEHEEEHVEPPGLRAFLERAAAILAEQRGINARSRVLLAAAAREFGLTDAEMERGIAALKAAVPDQQPQDAWQAEREQSFRVYLNGVFADLPHGVATARMEQDWIDAGCRRHGLEAPQAERLVRTIAAERGVRVITEDQAMQHVRGLVDQLLETSGRLDEQLRSRVFSEGGQWGLTPPQVDLILREQTRAKRRAAEAFAWWPGLVLAGCLSLLLAAAGALGWWFVFRKFTAPPTPVAQLGDDRPEAARQPAAPIEAPTGEQWWSSDEDLLIAVTQTRAVLPELKPLLVGLNAEQPDDRARMHRELIRMAAGLIDRADQRVVLQELISGCFAAEPSDACARAIAEQLLALTPAIGDPLPDDAAAYDAAFWALRTVATAATDPDVADPRRTLLADHVQQRLGWTLDLSLPPLELQTVCLRAFCRHLYRVITAASATQPLVARQLFHYVTQQAARYLDLAAIEQATVEFLAAALPAAEPSWREFAGQIQRCADSADPLIVLRMLEIYEQVQDPSLQAFLADRLLRRAGVFPQTMRPDEVAGAVRRALGADQFQSPSGRRDKLLRTTQRLLEASASAAAQRDELLRQIVQLAHAETMACALAQGTVGEATFDALDRDGPVRLAAWEPGRNGATEARRPEPAATDYQRDNVRRYIQYLLNPRSRVIQRNVFLRSIASLAPHVPEIDPELAENLATYVLRPKPDDEHAAMLEHLAAIGRWKSLRLALADQVLDTELQADRARDILLQIVPRQAGLTDDPMWRERAYELLLDSVLQELTLPASEDGASDRIVDDLAEALRELYVVQARLLGVGVDDYAAAATPSEVLRLIVQTYADRLPADQLSAAARDDLQGLPYRYDAARYVARNDLEQSVLLQRLWVRTLAAGIQRETPDRAATVRELVRELEQSDTTAGDLFVQLHAGHHTLLQLWLLAVEAVEG
jgi:hypothetical protein